MPFIETFLAGSDNENISHWGGIRLRVIGNGDLIPTYYGLDKVESRSLVNITMSEPERREPTRLANFVAQRCLLRLETNVIDDYMEIQRIILYAKEIYTQFPGTV